MSRPALAALAALLAVVPPFAAPDVATAQMACPARRGTHLSVHDDDGRRTMILADARRCLEVRSRGDVTFADDDGDVARLAPGAWLTVEETRDGAARRVEYAERDGQVRRRYFEEGRERDPADGAAWIRGILPQVARESAVGAEARAARILARGGAPALLAEVREIASDRVKGIYLDALLARPGVGEDDLREYARVTTRSLVSDSERRRLLVALTQRADATPAVLATVAQSARALVSDSEKARVLAAALDARRAGPEVRAAAVPVARTIVSDRAKGELLAALAGDDALLADAEGRRELFAAVDGIVSDRERGAVLRAVLRRDRVPRPAFLAALRSARGLVSDREKAEVLLAAAARREALEDEEARRAFLDATRGLTSSGEYRRVMDAVVR
ncbi:hypothetical protein [Roseisolibacter sp. H3M3-2]|uniref:hypothetical protein n=1 Tax=Roseisolibacter sp. H3M3-2 TaxID=3031323 RepID=UPI0023D99009|nr:hypothetical protein [Roseisolibacter sp. H3M3-2]MDF1505698.1 hypothetical protein [Roseisolibacter sp. H3M3-2]